MKKASSLVFFTRDDNGIFRSSSSVASDQNWFLSYSGLRFNFFNLSNLALVFTKFSYGYSPHMFYSRFLTSFFLRKARSQPTIHCIRAPSLLSSESLSMLGNLNFITFFIVLVKPINPLTHSLKPHSSSTGKRVINDTVIEVVSLNFCHS